LLRAAPTAFAGMLAAGQLSVKTGRLCGLTLSDGGVRVDFWNRDPAADK
jgi:hypothetical protein